MKKNLTSFLMLFTCILTAQVTIFPNGSAWKYLDNGSDQGTAWYGTTFNDASWSSGNSELGYGDGDEATVVNACGIVTTYPSCSNKYTTTYFRKTFTVASVASYTAYTINLRRDDGIIVYFNGVEVYRNNMPAGAVSYSTVASTACADDGTTVFNATLPTSVIVTGTNVIAAEIHQSGGTSSDISFEFNLVGNTTAVVPAIVKGPYLQIGTQNSMIVRWESDVATDSKVMYGTSTVALTSLATNTAVSVTHTVQLSGLTPYTKYFYNIGSSTLITQGDTNNYFLTSPVPGTPGKYRFWMVGDCGNASTNQINCKEQFKLYNGNRITNGMLLSGDNAYSSGLQSEFNAEFFGIYQNDVLKNKPLWPAPGNHDYNNGAATSTTVPYFSIFSTPTNGEAGGVPSNNPAYYSYDYGNIHFISIDSYGTVAGNKMYDTLGAQAVWLKADLAANNKKWTIAYWHHPPYTMGSHNSDTETDLVAVRSKFIRILERAGVDMIITGHSHDYERSKLMNGYYGNEASFSSSLYNKSISTGLYDGSANSCPYEKDSTSKKIGTVYVLSGSAGQLGGQQGSFPHDAMYYSNATNGGTFILDIEDNKLDAKWLCADGVIRDQFTMVKEVKKIQTFTVQPNQALTVNASWPGTYVWNNAATTRTLSVSSASDATFWVKDPNNCVTDTFKLKVLPAIDFTMATPYCAATAITFTDLSTNNTTAWTWSVTPSGGVTINSASSKNPSITFNTAGTYTVSLLANNIYGAGTLVTKTITINAKPTVLATLSSTAICVNQSATLTASGATSYTWSSGPTTTLISVNPTANTTYTLTGTDLNGCQNTNIKTLVVNALPSVVAVSTPTSAVICAGATLILNGSGANTYNWTGSITNGSSFTLNSGATYTVIGTDANGCQNTAVKSITVNALPVLTVVASPTNAIVCNGSTVALVASGASTYNWTGGITNGTSFTLSSGATYTVTGTDANGCQNTSVKSIVVNPLPTLVVNATPANATVCNGSTLTLSASGANTYTWSGTISNGTSFIPAASSMYTVTGTDNNGCKNSATQSVTVNALPIVSISGNTLVCSGITTSLAVSGASSYLWNTNATSAVITVNPSITTTYTVTGTDANGCHNTGMKTISVNPLPVITITGNMTVCAGKSTTITAAGATTYSWSNGTTTSSFVITPVSGTNYVVTGTDLNGCTNSASTNFNINVLPNVIAQSNNTLICAGESATLNASGATNYVWNTNVSLSSIVVSPTLTTTYSVTGTGANNCSAATSIVQNVSECTGIQKRTSEKNTLIYPNPNKGTFNIELNAQGNFNAEIFNALGERVYSAKLETGTNSIHLNENKGVYFYVIMDNTKTIETGKIIID